MPFTITLSKTCICSFESRLIVRSILRSILKSISYYLMVRWFILFRAMLILWRRFLWGKSRGIFEFCFTYPRDTWCKIKRKSSKMLNVLKISIIITTHTATLNWHCTFFSFFTYAIIATVYRNNNKVNLTGLPVNVILNKSAKSIFFHLL